MRCNVNIASIMLLAVAVVTACHTTTPDSAVCSRATVPLDYLPALRGDYSKLQSRAVGRPLHIYVSFPESYEKNLQARYPVVYVLDGDSLFPILAASQLFINYDEGVPEAIVVGIAYGSLDPATNKRGFDFSAPTPDADRNPGGAPAFHAFLKSDLIPEVEKRYRADLSRRVLYSAFTDPDLFWGRVASNPSLDPGRERFFSQPAAATRNDLGLVVTSGSRDHPASRENALAWFKAWTDRDDAAWTLKTATTEGGTHTESIAI